MFRPIWTSLSSYLLRSILMRDFNQPAEEETKSKTFPICQQNIETSEFYFLFGFLGVQTPKTSFQNYNKFGCFVFFLLLFIFLPNRLI